MNEALKPDDVTQRSAPATVETARPRRRSLLLRIAIVAALAAAAVFAWQKFEHSEPSTQEGENSGRHGQPPQTVRVAPVTLGDMPLTIDALGTVTPFETVTIRTQIAGNLQEVGFTEGQIVKKGDFLAQIDPRPYEAALAQAQGQLAKDTALLGQAQGDLTRYQAARQAGFDRQAAGRRPGGAGRAGQGRDRHRPGDGQDGPAQRRLHPYRLAGHRTGGPEAGRPRQLSAALRRHRHRRHHPDRSDQRRVHDAGGQSAAHLGAAQFRRRSSRSRCSTGTMSARSRPGR